MKNLDLLPVVNLYIGDGIFNVKALITPQRLDWIVGNVIQDNTKYVTCGCWYLALVRLKDEFVALYQKQGNSLSQFRSRRLVFVRNLQLDGQSFKALYVFYSGKIIILPAESLEMKKQCLYLEKVVVESDSSISHRKVKERYYLGFFNWLFFIKDKKSFYGIHNDEEVLCCVKCNYTL